MGGKFHLKLNIGGRPIANKYREGKMKRTLKRELKVPEIAEKEPLGSSVGSVVVTAKGSQRCKLGFICVAGKAPGCFQGSAVAM